MLAIWIRDRYILELFESVENCDGGVRSACSKFAAERYTKHTRQFALNCSSAADQCGEFGVSTIDKTEEFPRLCQSQYFVC